MDGIESIKKGNYSLFFITNISQEIKTSIRSRLSSICYGDADAATNQPLYSYKNTLKEFFKRYNSKSEAQQKGMIGELIFHIVLYELLNEYTVDSPFFNIEERNVKKGFDVVLNKSGTTELWITEVKSGNPHAKKNSSQTAVELINRAQKDLDGRLNNDSVPLWINAINGAKAAIKETRDDKAAIISLLQDFGSNATQDTLSSNSINVILVGTVFNPLSDRINEGKIVSKYRNITKGHVFNDVYLVAIQEETYESIVNFLEGECTI